jgi:hypothetical protein
VTTVQERFNARVTAEIAARPRPVTVTGLDGALPVVFEDPSLEHQIVIRRNGASRIIVSCNCLAHTHAKWYQAIESRGVFPARDALAAYHAWHSERGVRT